MKVAWRILLALAALLPAAASAQLWGHVDGSGVAHVALVAWNAGEGTVRKHGGEMPPIPETQAHVHLVLELYWALLQNNLQRGAHQLQMQHAGSAP